MPIVAGIVFVSAVGIPTGMPIKLVLLFAGAYLIGSLPALALAIAVAAAAELAGTMVLHGVARTGGARLIDRLSAERQAGVHDAFHRWRRRVGGRDIAAIAILRLIPVVRMGTTVGAGLLGVRLRDFAIGAGIAAVIWTAVPLSLGYVFHDQIDEIEGYYGSLLDALPAAIGGALLLIVVVVLLKAPATRLRLREAVAPLTRPFRPRPVSLPEIGQEPPPGIL